MTSAEMTAITNLPIIQYWHSPEIPGEVAELTATFRDRNPELRYLLFDEAAAETLIAEHLTAREVAAFRSCAVPAMQADYFRYCAILVLGGVYADVGFQCLRPLQTLIETADEGMLFTRKPQIINGFFLFKGPGHPFLRLVLDVATANIEKRVAETVNKVTGPWIFTGLEFIHRAGSLEAVRRMIIGEDGERLANPALDVIEDYTRVDTAFEGVRIAPMELAGKWIARPLAQLQYKQSETRWVGWHRRGNIFR
jgi:mannosyltransferase OCH1-like enzyme